MPRPIRPLRLAALALALAAGSAGAQDFRPALGVVQLNDVYRIDAVENGRAGGIGRVVTLVEQTKRASRGTPVMVLHAGDFIAPSLESRYFQGRQMIDALNFLDARADLIAVPGNHEFDESRPGMIAGAIRRSRFPWLAGNVTLATGDAEADGRLGRDTVFTAGGMKIGVFTLTFLDAPRDYATSEQGDFAALAEAQIAALEAAGAEAIVGLTHLNLDDDRRIARLKKTHPKLVWIAGGHEHFLIREEGTDSTALITKGDSNARRVWRVWIGRMNGAPAVRAEPVALDETIAVDPAYHRAVTRAWGDSLEAVVPFIHSVIGRSATPLDGTEETVRNAESAWGDWLADQMRGAFKDVRTDAAVLNGGAIRIDDVFEGEVRWEHLARTFGFPTRVGVVWLKGRDVREMLEHAVDGGRGEGRFLQVSGMRFRFDRARQPGQRVVDVLMQQEDGSFAPLDDARVYAVAVPDYLMTGGDGYTFHNRAVMSLPPGPDLRLIAFDALSSAYARGEAIAPRLEGRIAEAGAPPRP